MKCMWILFNHAVKMSANFVWNSYMTIVKSLYMIAVGNVVLGFGHCSIIVQINPLNVCEFRSYLHLKIIWNNIKRKVSEKHDYIVVITQHIKKNAITNY